MEWTSSCTAPRLTWTFRALEVRAVRPGPPTSSMEPMNVRQELMHAEELMAQMSGFDRIQDIHQMLSGTKIRQRITRFGVGVNTVLPEKCQTCQTCDAAQIVTCPNAHGQFLHEPQVGQPADECAQLVGLSQDVRSVVPSTMAQLISLSALSAKAWSAVAGRMRSLC